MRLNKEFWVLVSECWDVYSQDRVILSKNWKSMRFSWKQLQRWKSNTTPYPIMNISCWWVKHSWITKHRLVYATYNDLDYRWDYIVWHMDDDPNNNNINNLYYIKWKQNNKTNIEHKKKAYKILSMVMQWLIHDVDGNIIQYDDL